MPPREPEEIPHPERGFRLEFIFPNLWQNCISDTTRIVAAFVPVDDEHTLLYLRFYQRFFTVPLPGKLVTRLAAPANLTIAPRAVGRSTKRVVKTNTTG